ncbi:hypothetical protein HZS_4755, partial [Henneguya salminicola]
MVHHTLLGDGQGRRPNGKTPRIVIQIDESLLRGRRMHNRGRMLQGNEAISTDDQREFTIMQEGGEEVNINRNFGRRIAGPWIFGMVECHKQPNASYKSKEVRLYHVERCAANTLLPIIRDNFTPGSVVWSDQWPAYRRIWEEGGLIHEAVNHSTNFVSEN